MWLDLSSGKARKEASINLLIIGDLGVVESFRYPFTTDLQVLGEELATLGGHLKHPTLLKRLDQSEEQGL